MNFRSEVSEQSCSGVITGVKNKLHLSLSNSPQKNPVDYNLGSDATQEQSEASNNRLLCKQLSSEQKVVLQLWPFQRRSGSQLHWSTLVQLWAAVRVSRTMTITCDVTGLIRTTESNSSKLQPLKVWLLLLGLSPRTNHIKTNFSVHTASRTINSLQTFSSELKKEPDSAHMVIKVVCSLCWQPIRWGLIEGLTLVFTTWTDYRDIQKQGQQHRCFLSLSLYLIWLLSSVFLSLTEQMDKTTEDKSCARLQRQNICP